MDIEILAVDSVGRSYIFVGFFLSGPDKRASKVKHHRESIWINLYIN